VAQKWHRFFGTPQHHQILTDNNSATPCRSIPRLLTSTSAAGSCGTRQGDCDMTEIKWRRPQTGNWQLVLDLLLKGSQSAHTARVWHEITQSTVTVWCGTTTVALIGSHYSLRTVLAAAPRVVNNTYKQQRCHKTKQMRLHDEWKRLFYTVCDCNRETKHNCSTDAQLQQLNFSKL